MNTKLKAELEDHIDEWMSENCESGEWPNELVYEDLAADMAEAAARVFDASMKGQQFAAREAV